MLEYLKSSCEPVIQSEAVRINLIDDINVRYQEVVGDEPKSSDFMDKVRKLAMTFIEDRSKLEKQLARKRELFRARTHFRNIESFEEAELNEMYKDFFENRNQFHEKRKFFVRKLPTESVTTPESFQTSQSIRQ